MNKIESRFQDLPNCEIRTNEQGKEVITFDAIQYGKWSEVLGGWFRERIQQDAADHLLNSSDVYSVINHDNNMILGRQSNGRLTLKRDGNNIVAEVTPNDELSYVKDLKINIKDKNIQGASFRFTVAEDGEIWDRSKPIWERTITKFGGLYEVGPVTDPAYRSKSVKLEKRDFDSLTEIEKQEDEKRKQEIIQETENLNDELTLIKLIL